MCIVAALAIGYAITHEHRNPVESQTLNLYAGIAEIMHIVVKTVDIGSIQAVIVVAADENLVAIRQIAEPAEKVNRFLLATDQSEVAGIKHYISLGQIPHPPVASMSIRKMQNFHLIPATSSSFLSHVSISDLISSHFGLPLNFLAKDSILIGLCQ